MEFLIIALGLLVTFLRTIHLYPYNLYAILTLALCIYTYTDLRYQQRVIAELKNIATRVVVLEKQNWGLLKLNEKHVDCYVENKALMEELKKKDELISQLKEDRQKYFVAL